MGWMPDFSYVKSSYKDGSKDSFRFMKKKKGSLKVGELGKAAEGFTQMADVNKQTKGL